MPDMSLAAFIAHIATAQARIDVAEHRGLERAARLVENEAKAEIGTYQPEKGPFAAWAELADSTKADRVSQGYSENDPLMREGTLRESIDHRVGVREAVVGSDSEVAVYQELGTARIPPRSFLGGAAFREVEAVAHILGRSVAIGLVGQDVFGGRIEIGGED